jgi:hypothetical protein
MKPATTGVIASTGTKGLLTWIQGAMPNFYKGLSPALITRQKSLNAGKTMGRMGCAPSKLSALYGGSFSHRAGMGAMGDYGSYVTYLAPVNYTAPSVGDSILSSSGVSNPGNSDLTIAPSTTTTSAASVASSAPTSSALATTIASLASAVSTGTLAAAEVSANNTLLQTNLARAQQGLAPLTATTASNGMISLGTSSTTTVLLIGAALLAVVMMGGSKKTA